MSFTKEHAEATAKKLKTKPDNRNLPKLEVIPLKDGAHIQHQIFCNGVEVVRFGIKHGSHRNATHGWIARRFGIAPHDMREFANCNMSIDAMIGHLMNVGIIPTPPRDGE